MSAKNLDSHKRWRNITVGFRVSAEENELINKAVKLSGLPKQEYCYRRCLGQDIVVVGNPRVYKALKDELKQKRVACDECRKFVNAVTNYANFDPKTPTAKAMFRQLNRRIKEVNNIIDEINATQEGLEKSIRQHTVVVNAIQAKKANQDKED